MSVHEKKVKYFSSLAIITLVCDYTQDPETMYRTQELQHQEHGKNGRFV